MCVTELRQETEKERVVMGFKVMANRVLDMKVLLMLDFHVHSGCGSFGFCRGSAATAMAI